MGGRNAKAVPGLEVVRSTELAHASGISSGDLVTGIKLHMKVTDDAEFAHAMARIEPGDLLTVDVNRRGAVLAIPLHVPTRTDPPRIDAERGTGAPMPVRLADRPMFRFPRTQKVCGVTPSPAYYPHFCHHA